MPPPSQTTFSLQLSTVSMLLSLQQRQTWLCETTTRWVLGAAVVTSTTRAALEVTTSLPPTTPRGATHWLVMMTTTTKLQTGQHVFQVGAVVRFFWNRVFFSDILSGAWDARDSWNKISLFQFFHYGRIYIKSIFKCYLTLFTPAYFGISGTREGHIVPPLREAFKNVLADFVR